MCYNNITFTRVKLSLKYVNELCKHFEPWRCTVCSPLVLCENVIPPLHTLLILLEKDYTQQHNFAEYVLWMGSYQFTCSSHRAGKCAERFILKGNPWVQFLCQWFNEATWQYLWKWNPVTGVEMSWRQGSGSLSPSSHNPAEMTLDRPACKVFVFSRLLFVQINQVC